MTVGSGECAGGQEHSGLLGDWLLELARRDEEAGRIREEWATVLAPILTITRGVAIGFLKFGSAEAIDAYESGLVGATRQVIPELLRVSNGPCKIGDVIGLLDAVCGVPRHLGNDVLKGLIHSGTIIADESHILQVPAREAA